MLVLGIDENGLGPVLGPLVVTAASFETSHYDSGHFWKTARAIMHVDDSKKVFSRLKMAGAETATLGWLEAFGERKTTFRDMWASIVVDTGGPRVCGKQCPAYCLPSPQPLPCWAKPGDRASQSPPGVALGRGDLKPYLIRAVSVCPGEFNALTSDERMNKFKLDFNLMMRLICEIRDTYPGPVLALCGKIGSTRKYGPWFEDGHMGLCFPLEETREVSTYRVDDRLDISFIRDADALHFPVAVASMIGKYLRELSMRDLNERFGDAGGHGKWASGYRDPVTREFTVSSREKRLELGIPDECFFRKS